METSTINQLIESGGILLITYYGLKKYSKFYKMKENFIRESNLLMDILFFRKVEKNYQELNSEDEDAIGYNKMRGLVRSELNYNLSHYSEPARIANRLKDLENKNEKIKEILSKI